MVFYATNHFHYTLAKLYHGPGYQNFVHWPQIYLSNFPMIRYITLEFVDAFEGTHTLYREVAIDWAVANLINTVRPKAPRLHTFTLATRQPLHRQLFNDARIRKYQTATILRSLRVQVHTINLVTLGPETAFSALRSMITPNTDWMTELV